MKQKVNVKKNKKNTLLYTFLISIIMIASIVVSGFFLVDFNSLKLLSAVRTISESDIGALCEKNFFGLAINTNVNRTTSTELDEISIDLKLFGLFKIGNHKLNVIKDREIYLGGNVIATNFNTNGVMVSEGVNIISSEGEFSPAKKVGIVAGDVIASINGKNVSNIKSISDEIAIAGINQNEISLGIIKNGKKKDVKIKPVMDLPSQSYKLGLIVKDDLSGIGTLTYVEKDNLKFGALGHALYDENCKELLDVHSGNLTACNVLGVNKSAPGNAGEIKAFPGYGEKNELGQVSKNSEFGIFGKITNSEFFKEKPSMFSCGRFSVKPGNAKIYAQINNNKPEFFDVKIIKTARQTNKSGKGLVIKITDKRLLALTGGIVQGMSGSPIIQENKLVGAVTHMFLNDPTRGYGIYSDFMFEEI